MGALGRSTSRRTPTAADLEQRRRTLQIRSAARRGSTTADIAERYQLPAKVVERTLAAARDPRLADPADLLAARAGAPGLPDPDVQVYWMGFLTAAGCIWGQGASATLVVTLGEKSQAYVERLMADLAGPHVRYEFCRSSLLGWQLYIRDQALCRALIPWGIPSDLHGGDPGLLDDLPERFAAPFLRGYADGDWPAGRAAAGGRLTLHGTPAVLAGINAMARRCWGITGGVISGPAPRAQLRFRGPRAGREFLARILAYTRRGRGADADAALAAGPRPGVGRDVCPDAGK